MTRPPFEGADIIRAEGQRFIARNRSWLHGGHLKVLTAIERCRTAALGGHRDRCAGCGYEAPSFSFNSCRNRHCPKCQTNARDKWLAKRSADLLPVPYVHVVFTLPHTLAPLAYHNKKLLYGLLFRASAETLLEVARDPKHLGAELGILSVLHTWGQTLEHHPHMHCVIPAGGLSLDQQRWVPARSKFFLPVRVLSHVFRGKFVAELQRLWRGKRLCLPGPLKVLKRESTFRAFVRSLYRKKWVVYSKPPFGGPEHVLHYLARYTHREAISNHRITNFANGKVSFRWKDYARNGEQRVMMLEAHEFLWRFLLHLLPLRFVRIRSFGFLANRRRSAALPLCRRLLAAAGEASSRRPAQPPAPPGETARRCPQCGGPMMVIERLTAQQLQAALEKGKVAIDSS